jgi:hypothetical protein
MQVIGGAGFVDRAGDVATTWDKAQPSYTVEGAASSGGASGKGTVALRFIPQPATPGTLDTNDTPHFFAATIQAAPGAAVDAGGEINDTDVTAEIGDIGWWRLPVV